VPGNGLEWFTSGEQLFSAMLTAIEGATSAVWLEMYWFSAGEVGRRFFGALTAALGRGVEVRVMYDSLGSVGTPRHWFDELSRAGASVVEFNPISPLQMRFRLQRMTVRDHRKLLVVDSAIAFVGGINIADEWASNDGQSWKDDSVCVRGPVVTDLVRLFAESWFDGCGERLPMPTAPPAAEGELAVAVLAQRGLLHRQDMARVYLARLRAARERVFIANAYFLPSSRLRRALSAAARRGVDVRIMLPGRSDVPVIRLASRGIWAPLLAAGVRIYEWQPTILHSKIAVVDGQWVTVGSFNLDYISLRTNRELNLSMMDTACAALVEARFLRDLEQCTEVDEQSHRRRPFILRVLERVLYWGRAWL
jgi:cardiolipin synthase A/B